MAARKPTRLTPAQLESIALDYLAQFAASRKRVQEMLQRRIRKSAAAHGDDPAPMLAAVAGVIAALERKHLLDDAAFAGMKAASLTRRGTSRRMVGAKLAQLGVDPAGRSEALAGLEEEFGDTDEAAALNYARRRRLGRFRTRHIVGEQRIAQQRRDLAAMLRAGFAFALARRILEAADIEGEED